MGARLRSPTWSRRRMTARVDERLVGEADRRPLVQQRVAVTAWLHNDCIRTVWSEDAHPPVHQNLQVQRVVGMARREGLEPPTLRFEA